MSPNQLVLLSAALILLTGCTQQGDPATEAAVQLPVKPDPTSQISVSSNPGRNIYIDPVTGELTSSPSTDATTVAETVFDNRPAAITTKITQTVADDGTVSFHYDGGYRMKLRAQIDCNGKLLTSHTTSTELPADGCTPSEDAIEALKP